MVVGRGHLHDVDTGQREFHGTASYGVEELASGQPARFRCTGTGSHPGVDNVDVDRQEHALAAVHRHLEHLIEADPQPPVAHLGHLVAPHPLRRHPVQHVGIGPVPAQPDLEKPFSAHGP